jgi:hypothetical protein
MRAGAPAAIPETPIEARATDMRPMWGTEMGVCVCVGGEKGVCVCVEISKVGEEEK